MRTTLALDDDLLAKAEALIGVSEKTALVREASRRAQATDALYPCALRTHSPKAAFMRNCQPCGVCPPQSRPSFRHRRQ